MVDSLGILSLMKVVYSIYLVVVFAMMGTFVIAITRRRRVQPRFRVPFYGWVALLVIAGVGIHVLTFNKIPWVKWEKENGTLAADRAFDINVSGHRFQLPSEQLLIDEGEMVRFNVESDDYTYGFGLFRDDGSMVFQMQVVPGYNNSIVWKFSESGTFDIRSTEYSGPRGGNLLVSDAVVVGPSVASSPPISE